MKKLFLLFAFTGVVALANAQAQQCQASMANSGNHACCAKTAAAKAAALDNTIEQRVNAETGEVSYVRKVSYAGTDKVTYTDVEYCTKAGKFINVSPGKKSCCNKGAEGAGCEKSKSPTSTSSASTSTSTPKSASVKLVSNKNQ